MAGMVECLFRSERQICTIAAQVSPLTGRENYEGEVREETGYGKGLVA